MVIGLLAHITLAALLLPSIIHQQPGKVGITNWELLILGVTGCVAYCLALTGLHLGRHRHLLPLLSGLVFFKQFKWSTIQTKNINLNHMGAVANVHASRPLFPRLLVVCEVGGVATGHQGSAQAIQERPLPQSGCFPDQGKREEAGGGEGLLSSKERCKAWKIPTILVVPCN